MTPVCDVIVNKHNLNARIFVFFVETPSSKGTASQAGVEARNRQTENTELKPLIGEVVFLLSATNNELRASRLTRLFRLEVVQRVSLLQTMERVLCTPQRCRGA